MADMEAAAAQSRMEQWQPDPPRPELVNAPGYLDFGFIERREVYYTERDGRPVLAACGDEGAVLNSRELVQGGLDIMSPAEGMHANFGQAYGLASIAAAVGIATHGPEFLEAVGGFDALCGQFVEYMKNDGEAYAVRPAGHSDRTKERAARWNDPEVADPFSEQVPPFYPLGQAAIACAYAANLGRVPQAIGNDPGVQAVIIDNIQYFFGVSDNIPGLFDGYAQLAATIGPEYAVGRQRLVQDQLPVMVLGRLGNNDAHLEASQTGLIFNLDPTQASRTHDHYRVDIASAALVVRRVMRDRLGTKLELPVRRIMEAVIADSVPVRSVLVSHDASGNHDPNPRRLAVGARGGTVDEALAKIEAIEGRLAA